MDTTRLIRIFLIAFACGDAAAAGAQSETFVPKMKYPVRPIRLIVPTAPGGGADISARIIAIKLADVLGQQIVVDNRAGGSGIIGSSIVKRASPDGYTLLFAYNSHTITPFLVKNVPYDALNSFTPITEVATSPLGLTIHPSLPVNSVKEFIAYAKARPGKLNLGLATVGSAGHIASEYFKQVTGTDFTSIVYSGGSPTQIALLSGEVQVSFVSMSGAIPFVKQGKVKLLAVLSKRRLPYLPDVSTLEEAGLKSFEIDAWRGLFGPAGLPHAIVDRLYTEVAKLLQLPEVRERLASTGHDAVGSTPKDFGARIKRELEQFETVIKTAGIEAK